MTLYFDTSFLAPPILEEAISRMVERFMARLPPGKLTISQWTRVEFSSLLAREVRIGGLDRRAARDADAQFETIIAESFAILPLDDADCELAKRFIQRYETGLRRGDALHLAVAANHRAEAIYTLDRALLKAGRTLGLPMATGIRLGARI